jgi:hypothetical protein
MSRKVFSFLNNLAIGGTLLLRSKRSIRERAQSALANGQRQEWQERTASRRGGLQPRAEHSRAHRSDPGPALSPRSCRPHGERSSIKLPEGEVDALKFVREAVRTYPELYFARFTVLGEGASEEVVLPQLADALGFAIDRSFVAVVPLGGRHVNHQARIVRRTSW